MAKKTEIIAIRVTQDEKEAFEFYAKEHGLKTGKAMRILMENAVNESKDGKKLHKSDEDYKINSKV